MAKFACLFTVFFLGWIIANYIVLPLANYPAMTQYLYQLRSLPVKTQIVLGIAQTLITSLVYTALASLFVDKSGRRLPRL